MSSAGNKMAAQRARAGLKKPRRAARAVVEGLERRVLLSASILPNVAITSDPGVQQMPSIAADPLDSRHLVVSYMDHSLLSSGYAGIGVGVSHDGGISWQRTGIALPAGFSQGASDPATVFDGQGRVFVSFMAVTFLGTKPTVTNPNAHARSAGFTSNNGVFVAASNDGGTTWGSPTEVTANFYGGAAAVPFDIQPELAIDTFGRLADGQPNPNFGNEYISWTELYPAGQFPGDPKSSGGGAVMLSVSTDGGQTWQLRQQTINGVALPVIGANDPGFTGKAPPGLTGQLNAHCTIGPNGELFAAYFMFGSFAVVHSTDAGRSFNSVNVDTGSGFPFYYGAYIGATDSASSNPGALGAGGPTNNFRTVPVRQILSDPTRPGILYAVEAVATFDADGASRDPGDIFFARSTDFGATWTSTFQVGGHPANVLNDDNGGNISKGTSNDVADAQAMPRMSIDSHGNLAVIWYDTRHDPNNHLLDVYGTVSTDGGQSFSPNFRVSDSSFDANAGRFTTVTGSTEYYLGDRIGLSIADGIAYATWTDTRDGNQDIELGKFAIDPAPPPANDRFGPNDSPATATPLGTLIDRTLPRLNVAAGTSEWFALTAAATGNLKITAISDTTKSGLRLELRNADGTALLAGGTNTSDGQGNITGQQIQYPGVAGQNYLVRIVAGNSVSAGYSVHLQSLTADLGTAVVGIQQGVLAPGDQAYYLLQTAAAGSINVTLSPGGDVQGNLNVEVLDPVNSDSAGHPAVLASGTPGAGGVKQVALSVTRNQPLLLHVFGSAPASGHFTLSLANLDVFAAGLGASLPFPAGNGPSQVVMADVNHDGKMDLIVSDALTDTVSVLLGNGDGTFQAPREYAVGAMDASVGSVDNLAELRTFKRGLAVADLIGNGNLDIVVTNPASADVSVLLGNGDGTFKPQRRFDAGPLPNSVVTGDFNGDGIPDLAVLSTSFGYSTLAILLGRGNGTFLPARLSITPVLNGIGIDGLSTADVTGDGKMDLLLTGGTNQQTYIYSGNGDGTFRLAGNFIGSGPGIAVADLNGDGIPDVVNANFSNSTVSYVLGNGDGTFRAAPQGPLSAGVTPLAVTIADVGSQVTLPDGSTVLGPPDGRPDLIIADSGIPQTVFSGPPEIVVLPAIFDSNGFEGFGSPVRIATGMRPASLAAGSVSGGAAIDIAYVDNDGVHIIFPANSPPLTPNNTPQTARDLGVGVHVLEPTLTIVPGHEDAYYAITVPTEAAPGSGDEVIDFNGGFQATQGAGLNMQVSDLAGNVLASGEHIRLRLPQGQRLILHVFGVIAADGSRGAGAYTLDVDVLPQVVSVAAEPLLAGKNGGGPASTLVITLQGDRLDPAAAQDPSNYTVTWLGPDGVAGTADDRVLTPDGAIVYDPSANVDVASGLTYPTAIRQTVTLTFSTPLRPGAYLLKLSSRIGTAPFNEDERALLLGATSGNPHPVVQLTGGGISEGVNLLLPHLVRASGAGNFDSFSAGTPFLTQLHDDLGAVLDAALSHGGDQPAITLALLNVVVGRFAPGLHAVNLGGRSVLVIWLDPPELDIADSAANHIRYNAADQSVIDGISNAFVSVAGNVELVVLPGGIGGANSQFALTLADVRDTSRGGAVLFTPQGDYLFPLTDSLRAGQSSYEFGSNAQSPGTPSVALLDRATPSHVFVALITAIEVKMTREPAKAAPPPAAVTIAAAEPAPPLMPGAWLAVTRRHQPGWIELFGTFLQNTIDAIRGFFTAIQQSAGRPVRSPPPAPAAKLNVPVPAPPTFQRPPDEGGLSAGVPSVDVHTATFLSDARFGVESGDDRGRPGSVGAFDGAARAVQPAALLAARLRVSQRDQAGTGGRRRGRRRLPSASRK